MSYALGSMISHQIGILLLELRKWKKWHYGLATKAMTWAFKKTMKWVTACDKPQCHGRWTIPHAREYNKLWVSIISDFPVKFATLFSYKLRSYVIDHLKINYNSDDMTTILGRGWIRPVKIAGEGFLLTETDLGFFELCAVLHDTFGWEIPGRARFYWRYHKRVWRKSNWMLDDVVSDGWCVEQQHKHRRSILQGEGARMTKVDHYRTCRRLIPPSRLHSCAAQRVDRTWLVPWEHVSGRQGPFCIR